MAVAKLTDDLEVACRSGDTYSVWCSIKAVLQRRYLSPNATGSMEDCMAVVQRIATVTRRTLCVALTRELCCDVLIQCCVKYSAASQGSAETEAAYAAAVEHYCSSMLELLADVAVKRTGGAVDGASAGGPPASLAWNEAVVEPSVSTAPCGPRALVQWYAGVVRPFAHSVIQLFRSGDRWLVHHGGLEGETAAAHDSCLAPPPISSARLESSTLATASCRVARGAVPFRKSYWANSLFECYENELAAVIWAMPGLKDSNDSAAVEDAQHEAKTAMAQMMRWSVGNDEDAAERKTAELASTPSSKPSPMTERCIRAASWLLYCGDNLKKATAYLTKYLYYYLLQPRSPGDADSFAALCCVSRGSLLHGAEGVLRWYKNISMKMTHGSVNAGGMGVVYCHGWINFMSSIVVLQQYSTAGQGRAADAKQEEQLQMRPGVVEGEKLSVSAMSQAMDYLLTTYSDVLQDLPALDWKRLVSSP